jgi:hypothetical protein
MKNQRLIMVCGRFYGDFYGYRNKKFFAIFKAIIGLLEANIMRKFAMSQLILSFILIVTLCGCGGGNGGNGKQDSPNAGLNGLYYMAGLNINSGGESSSITEIIFDGNRNFTFEQIFGDKYDGNQERSGSGTYVVNADGSCTFKVNNEVTDARLSADGRTFVAATIDSTSVFNVSVGVKHSP